MVKALWTAASGMNAHQTNVDVISNNLSNVNTAGYKRETAQFKTLFYQTLQNNSSSTTATGSMQVGIGVRTAYIARDFSTGVMQQTGNLTDLSIQGNGFFAVSREGNEMYTKDGGFRLALYNEDSYTLATSDGYPLVDINGEVIEIPRTISMEDITISPEGEIYYAEGDSNILLSQIKVVQFANPEGLSAAGANLFEQTAASGNPVLEINQPMSERSTLLSGYLEGSNVQVADEMVQLIVAQRAYELSSTVIKTADTMMQQANDLKRV